ASEVLCVMSFFDTKDRGTDYVLIDGVGGGDTFNRPPLPQTIDEYKQYKEHTIDLMKKRNKRILESIFQIN
ncbi:hypothetical protein LX69_03553, partial [Breznakibacter xylanolyticus]